MNNHPDTQRVVELANLMASYPTPHAFMKQELNYNSEWKARILQAVVKFVCQIVQKAPNAPKEEALKKWAMQAKPEDYLTLNIRGFGLAGFQYLRMLFGADTTKPDVYIIRFVSETLNRKVSDVESLLLLEAASERTGLSARAVDYFIWNRGARGTGTNIVRLAPDVVAAFPNEEDVNEALRFALRVMDDAKQLARHCD